jgi:methionyl-tRNA synthetase
MYLTLDKIQPRVEEWIKHSWKTGRWSPNAVINASGEIIDARLKGGLLPTAITRDLTWGVPVPIVDGEDDEGLKGKVLCKPSSSRPKIAPEQSSTDVWVSRSTTTPFDAIINVTTQFDAPIGYPSITANYTPEWRRWWFNRENVRLYQFMGKDNVYFHTVYFPSMQHGDGRDWTMLHHISTTGEAGVNSMLGIR